MSKTINIPNLRLLAQQLAAPQFGTAHEVVRWMGFVQAQDYAQVPWAIGVRMKRPLAKGFEHDFDAGLIVRTHLFRNTVQMVAADDLLWMQMLMADRWKTTEMGWAKSDGVGNSPSSTLAMEHVVRQLEMTDALTKEAIGANLRQDGVEVSAQQLAHVLRWLEYDGVVCSGPMTGRFATFALQDRRIKHPLKLTRDEALVQLAQRYFQSHGPATIDDFAWWTGLSKKDCRQAIADLGDLLVTATVDGESYYMAASARTRGCRASTIVLPGYDEYLIGYKTRQHVLHPDFAHKAHNHFGIFWPVVVHSGQVIGNWTVSTLRTEIFDQSALHDVDGALAKYRQFINTRWRN